MSSNGLSTIEGMQAIFEGSPYIKFLDLKVEALDVEAGRMEVSMPMKPELLRTAGTDQFHGGPIAGLIDTVGTCLVVGMINNAVPTINFRVDYVRPATGEGLRAVATARRVGRTLAVCDIDVFDKQDRLVAVGRGSFAVTRPA